MTKMFKTNAEYFKWYRKKRDVIKVLKVKITKKMKKIVISYEII